MRVTLKNSKDEIVLDAIRFAVHNNNWYYVSPDTGYSLGWTSAIEIVVGDMITSLPGSKTMYFWPDLGTSTSFRFGDSGFVQHNGKTMHAAELIQELIKEDAEKTEGPAANPAYMDGDK